MKWRQIDTAPTDGEEFVGSCGEYVYIAWYDRDRQTFVWNRTDGDLLLTHWQPLPRLPREGE